MSGARDRLISIPSQQSQVTILVVNAGSSSLKVSLFPVTDNKIPYHAAWEIEEDVDWQNQDQDKIHTQVEQCFLGLWQGDKAVVKNAAEIKIVGHRVVHGGQFYLQPQPISQEIKDKIAGELAELAPLHNPINVRALDIAERLMPNARHIAVFDTAFHQSLPPEAFLYPVPYQWYEQWKIRKYGFHGISHQFCSARARQILNVDTWPLTVSCHLGGGCSLAAVKEGKSIDTTMGFTPLDGLMMRSRSGAVDPGILIHVLKEKNMTVDGLNETLNSKSGLKGIYEKTGDMREIIEAMPESERAKLAFALFVHHLSAGIASMAAALAGLEVLIFTGGIGEHSADVRQAACRRLQFLNIDLNEEENQLKPVDKEISNAASKVKVLVIKSREDWQIASECMQFGS